mgnify:CR=1 FL=1
MLKNDETPLPSSEDRAYLTSLQYTVLCEFLRLAVSKNKKREGDSMTASEKFQRLLLADTKYDKEAYNFIYEALDWTLKYVVKIRDKKIKQHVTGRELCEGVRQYAIDQYGCLALTVLKNWNVHSTDDIGKLVFNLVKFGLMGKQEEDSQNDFHDVFKFIDEFTLKPDFFFNQKREEWNIRYSKCSKKKNVPVKSSLTRKEK